MRGWDHNGSGAGNHGARRPRRQIRPGGLCSPEGCPERGVEKETRFRGTSFETYCPFPNWCPCFWAGIWPPGWGRRADSCCAQGLLRGRPVTQVPRMDTDSATQ
ncbi:MAG: hypothetical protein GY697_11120 [Desulfobacterales bacterium]|nr:hypothetical protein [Desulfobacterales bacterium]